MDFPLYSVELLQFSLFGASQKTPNTGMPNNKAFLKAILVGGTVPRAARRRQLQGRDLIVRKQRVTGLGLPRNPLLLCP